MLSLAIWWSTFLFGAVILLRGLGTRSLGKYPFFYAYIACVLFKSVFLHFYFASNPDLYRIWYWRTDILTLVAGCGIVLEIVERVLSPYPGAERFARTAGLVTFGSHFFLLSSLIHGSYPACRWRARWLNWREICGVFSLCFCSEF